MHRRGLQGTSRVLESSVTITNTALAKIFQLEIGARVIVLHRLRLADGEPIALQKSFLPYKRFPDLLSHDFGIKSLYEVLRQHYGVVFANSSYSVEAALAEDWEAQLLNLSLPAALLITEQSTAEEDGTIIEHVRSAYRGDRYKMQSAKAP